MNKLDETTFENKGNISTLADSLERFSYMLQLLRVHIAGLSLYDPYILAYTRFSYTLSLSGNPRKRPDVLT